MKLPSIVKPSERKACEKYMKARVKWEKQQPAFIDAIEEFEKAVGGKARATELWKQLDRLC